MATAEQIKALIRSHSSNNAELFYTVALQVAANEAQQGHGALAQDIREIVNKARDERRGETVKFPNELRGLVLAEISDVPKSALVLPGDILKRFDRIIHEFKQQAKLKNKGLNNRRKIMFVGPPGTGKTMSAKVLSHELHLSLYTVQVDKLVTKFMGETSAKLRQIFDLIQHEQGVYLFDEFDAIGGERSLDNDVGEMRRVLNSFLQFIEQDNSGSLIIAATNNPKLLDRALFRRFDDVLFYEMPSREECRQLMENVMAVFLSPKFNWKNILKDSNGLSQAEIVLACRDAIKQSILEDKEEVNVDLIRNALKERQSSRLGFRG